MGRFPSRVGDRYDWTTGVLDIGNEWWKFGVVPCSHPLRPVVLSFTKAGNRRAFSLPGEGGDHFHCTVEPSFGHILGYFVTTRMGATRIGFSRPAGFDLGLRTSGVHMSGLRSSGVYISGPEFEISRPQF